MAGVGTGGTIMGMRKYLKKKNPDMKIHPLGPTESPPLSTGYKTGSHRIQGFSEEFIPAIVKLNELGEIIPVSDGDSILMAQKMTRQLGLAVGISSGANILGTIKAHQHILSSGINSSDSPELNVVTVLPDSNKKYLNTDLLKEEPVKTDT